MCPLKVPRSTFHGCRHTDASRCAQRLLYIRRHASPFLISCASPLSAGSQPAAASTPDREASRNWDFASYRHVVCGTRRWGALSSVVACSHSKTAKAPLPPAACSDKPTAQHHPSTASCHGRQEAVLHVKWPKLALSLAFLDRHPDPDLVLDLDHAHHAASAVSGKTVQASHHGAATLSMNSPTRTRNVPSSTYLALPITVARILSSVYLPRNRQVDQQSVREHSRVESQSRGCATRGLWLTPAGAIIRRDVAADASCHVGMYGSF